MDAEKWLTWRVKAIWIRYGSTITSDAGLLAFRELGDALGLTEAAAERLVDPRTGKNGQHGMFGLLRQSLFGLLGGYEDVNDAERLSRDPAMCWVVGAYDPTAATILEATLSQFRVGMTVLNRTANRPYPASLSISLSHCF